MLRAFAEQARLGEVMPARAAMRSVWEPADRALRKVLRHEAEPRVAPKEEARRRFDDVRSPAPAGALRRCRRSSAVGALGLLRRIS